MKKIFEPEDPEELLRGWLLHCHKSRDRHDQAARLYDTYRYSLGIPAVILSAVAGSSIFASMGTTFGTAGGIIAGILAMASAVLAALQTFLDYPGRAERHRSVAARFKAIIRELEQALTGELGQKDPQDRWFSDLRARCDALEDDSVPVVPQKIYDRVQTRYEGMTIVGKALDLTSGDANALPDARK